jgi:serine protease Do
MRYSKTILCACLAAGLTIPAARAQNVIRRGDVQSLFDQVQKPVSYIGVGIQEIDADRAKALNLKEEAGVEITRVETDSPAERAGLKTGDVVIQYNGQRVEGIEQFSRMVRETPAGRDAKVEIMRNGAPQTVSVKIATRKPQNLLSDASPFPNGGLRVPTPDIPRNRTSLRSSTLGVEAEGLEGQLAGYFGVTEGVLVRSVNRDSAAEKAGVKAGDVITKIDGNRVATPADVSRNLQSARGNSVPLVVMRDHKEVTLNVPLDADRAAPRTRDRAERGEKF